jgi:hypothetical protein
MGQTGKIWFMFFPCSGLRTLAQAVSKQLAPTSHNLGNAHVSMKTACTLHQVHRVKPGMLTAPFSHAFVLGNSYASGLLSEQRFVMRGFMRG